MTQRQTANKAISLEMHGLNLRRDMHAQAASPGLCGMNTALGHNDIAGHLTHSL